MAFHRVEEDIASRGRTPKYIRLEYMKSHKSVREKRQFRRKQKWPRDLNRHFTKEDIQIASKHRKTCTNSLKTRKMQIKIHCDSTISYHNDLE